MMKLAICNEIFEGRTLAETCRIACELGYDGLELAPYTMVEATLLDCGNGVLSGSLLPAKQIHEQRCIIEDHGLETVGLHWLYAKTNGLHVTTPDDAVWWRTVDFTKHLIDLCAGMGGKVMVFGSPQQRSVPPGQTPEGAWGRIVDLFASVIDQAAQGNVCLCIEPLGSAETDFINSVADGVRLVRELDHPNMKVHLDVKAMKAEPRPIAETIRQTDVRDIGHFHVQDPNLYGPGMGEEDYAPIAEAVKEIGWDQWLSVEAFKYDPTPEAVARQSINYLRKFWP